MLQLLVSRRDELTIGDLVSVGDLFDVLAEHDEPFTEDLKQSFEHANRRARVPPAAVPGAQSAP